MDPYDPILDQPHVIEVDAVTDHVRYRMANQDILFLTDANSDLYGLDWPWAGERYVRSIVMSIHDPIGEELMTLVTRHYPGYQETILGNEGMIISKRITAPVGSHYDRAVLWTLECQAEGDRLLRLDIEIDWGGPLTQRIVDGLLVAQINPKRAQGIYKQRNADRTCVYGNPQGRPTSYEFDDEGRATLTYYVLVNGIVEVPLLLTVSDVGEQVAWNGFLALRDTEREFEASAKHWELAVKSGRLWTSSPRLNRAVQEGRLECLRTTQRMRTGYAPTSRLISDVPAHVDCLDVFDVTLSRNMLANLRRVAEKGEGRIPEFFPVRPKDRIDDPGDQVIQTNSAYLQTLYRHLSRRPDAELLDTHMAAVRLCAESLIRLRRHAEHLTTEQGPYDVIARSLGAAASLAAIAGDDVNAARWESEARFYDQAGGASPPALSRRAEQWLQASGWHCPEDAPCGFAESNHGIQLSGEAAWSITGLKWQSDGLWVYPMRVSDIRWWALMDFPMGDGAISMVWDGTTLYTTMAVQSDQPVQICEQVRVRNAEEHNFDLRFDITLSAGPQGESGEVDSEIIYFRPTFDQGDGE